MAYCVKCGVELDIRMTECPLCGTAAQGQYDLFSAPVKPVDKYPEINPVDDSRSELTRQGYNRLMWELISILFLIGIIVSITVNLTVKHTIAWSGPVSGILLAAWGITTVTTFLWKRYGLLIISWFILSSIMLMTIDMFDQTLSWSLNIALPINFVAFIMLLLMAVITKKAQKKGLNLLAIYAPAIAVVALFIDIFTAKSGTQTPSWSLIVSASMVAFSILLLFIHTRFKKALDLRKYFHL